MAREGKFMGIPYDWRRPTARRVKSRWWNARDRRIVTPKSWGWGFGLNLYWFAHPFAWLRARR